MQFADIESAIPQIAAEVLRVPVSAVTVHREPEPAPHDQPWLAVKYGAGVGTDVHGITRVTVHAGERDHHWIAKVNPTHGIGETLIPWICDTRGVALPHPYATYHSTREVIGTGAREANVYDLSITMPELMAVLPEYFGTVVSHGERAVLLADLGRLRGLDAGGAAAPWSPADIDAALRAIGAVHAASAGSAADTPWLPPRNDTATMTADASLWRALLADAAERFPGIVTSEVRSRRERLIDTIEGWHAAKDAMPTVVAHNDFNPRNVGFRPDDRVVVLDWEIARRDSPQRDVAEMLTFALRPDAGEDQVRRHAEQHRAALAATGVPIDPAAYLSGLAAEFRCEAIDRVGMQLLFAAAFELPYVPRINATVDRLVELSEPWLI